MFRALGPAYLASAKQPSSFLTLGREGVPTSFHFSSPHKPRISNALGVTWLCLGPHEMLGRFSTRSITSFDVSFLLTKEPKARDSKVMTKGRALEQYVGSGTTGSRELWDPWPSLARFPSAPLT